jgi:hypothetical protein
MDTGHLFRSRACLSDVRFDTEKLVVTVTCSADGTAASATISEVVGFRVLDEADLLEFRPACGANNGWLFRVSENGWFDQEIARPGFLCENALGLAEYFIASQNDCISVLAGATSKVEAVQPERDHRRLTIVALGSRPIPTGRDRLLSDKPMGDH